MLSPDRVKQFYDRFGSRQDRQGFYEDRAVDHVLAYAEFGSASTIVEFGCGTGRVAERLLKASPAPAYIGYDISTTMIQLATARLAGFGKRAQVRLLEPGAVELPLPAASADRLLSTYVLDLLPVDAIDRFLADARRVLKPGGRLGLVSITPGVTALSAVAMGLWTATWRLAPGLVGGCRPILLGEFVAAGGWHVEHSRTIVNWGIASEVLVATLPDTTSDPAARGR